MSDASLQHWREGVGAYNAGDIQRAIHQFKAAAPSKGVLFNLGVATAKLGDNQGAIRHFDEVLRLDPHLGVAYLTRGACKHHEKMFNEAIVDYDCALASIADNGATLDYSGEGLQFEMNRVDLLFNRALALKEVGRIAEAQDDTAKARKLVDSRTTSRQAALEKLTSQLANMALTMPTEVRSPAKDSPSDLASGFASLSKANGSTHANQFNVGSHVPAPAPLLYQTPPPQQPQQQQQQQQQPPPPQQQQQHQEKLQVPAPQPAAQQPYQGARDAPPPQESLAVKEKVVQRGAPSAQQREAAPPSQPAPAPSPAAPVTAKAPPAAAPAASSGSTPFYSLEVLTGRPPFPDGVDPTKRELYLSDVVFKEVFNTSKEEFANMPPWKRDLLKKKKNLF